VIDLAEATADRRPLAGTADRRADDATASSRFERIRWLDSGMQLAADEWTSIAGLRARSVASAMEVVTAGLLVHEDDDVVVLGLSIDEPGDAVFGAQVIWKSAILERHGLVCELPASDVA
jgi:hypothetical protein